MFFLNVQCLRNKIYALNAILSLLNLSLIAICEHWIHPNAIGHYQLDGYTVGSHYARETYKNGGTIIFVKNNIQFTELVLDDFCVDIDIEVSGILIPHLNVIVIAAYRSPSGSIKFFNENIELLLNFLDGFKAKILFFGDFNVNFLNDSNAKLQLCNIFNSYDCHFTISEPTRSESCLDN